MTTRLKDKDAWLLISRRRNEQQRVRYLIILAFQRAIFFRLSMIRTKNQELDRIIVKVSNDKRREIIRPIFK